VSSIFHRIGDINPQSPSERFNPASRGQIQPKRREGQGSGVSVLQQLPGIFACMRPNGFMIAFLV